jgi:hypothetical protein
MTMRRSRLLPSLGVSALLFVIAAIMVAVFFADRRSHGIPLEIANLTVVPGGSGPDRLLFAGTRGETTLQALLLPVPVAGDGDSEFLAPRMPIFQFDTDGSVAVASTRNRRVVVIDVQDGRSPRILGSVEVRKEGLDGDNPSSDGILALVKLGTRAVVSFSNGDGLALLDLTDPYAPRELDYLPLAVDVTDLLAMDGQVIAAGVRSGLWQIKIDGDRLRASKLPGVQGVWRLARDGNRLAAVSLRGDLFCYEVEGVSLPHLVGQMQLPGEVRGVTFDRDVLHVCMGDGTLLEYAAEPWPRFVARGQLRLPGRPLRLIRDKESPRLLCSLVGVGAAVVDVSRPGHPAIAAWLPTGLAIADLAIDADRVLITNKHGLQIHRLSRLVGQLNVEFLLDSRRKRVGLLSLQGEVFAYDATRLHSLGRGEAGTSAVPPSGEDLLALPGDNCVRLYARRGDGFVQVASQPIKGPVRAALWRKGRVFALNDTTLEVFACDTSGACQPAGRLAAFSSTVALAWADPHYLLVADRHAGVKLVTVQGVGAPRFVAELLLPDFLKHVAGIQDVLVSGQRAFVARGQFGVQIIDLADLPAMKTLQLVDTPGRAQSLAMDEGLLLVADLGRGIQVIDARKPWCRVLGTIGTPFDAKEMVVQGKELLISSTNAAVTRMPAPLQLGAVRPADAGHGQVTLPAGLPKGRYQLIVYDDRHLARADFTMQ